MLQLHVKSNLYIYWLHLEGRIDANSLPTLNLLGKVTPNFGLAFMILSYSVILLVSPPLEVPFRLGTTPLQVFNPLCSGRPESLQRPWSVFRMP
jgi:hypothetical protein